MLFCACVSEYDFYESESYGGNLVVGGVGMSAIPYTSDFSTLGSKYMAVFGGIWDGIISDNIGLFDLEDLSWTSVDSGNLGSLSPLAYSQFIANYNSTRYYIIGGVNELFYDQGQGGGARNGVFSSADVYHQNWRTETSFPTNIAFHCAVASPYSPIGPVGSYLYVYGGRSSQVAAPSSLLYQYDVTSRVWTLLAPKGDVPLARNRHRCIATADGTKMIAIGGSSSSQNITATYDFQTGLWENIPSPLDSTYNFGESSAMIYPSGTTDVFYEIIQSNGQTPSDPVRFDVYTFNLGSKTTTSFHNTTTARMFDTGIWDRDGAQVFLYGSVSKGDNFFIYTPSAQSLSSPELGSPPPARMFAQCLRCRHNAAVVLFGGTNADEENDVPNSIDDVVLYSSSRNAWLTPTVLDYVSKEPVNISTTFLGSRSRSVVARGGMVAHGVGYVFGGLLPDGTILGDFWRFQVDTINLLYVHQYASGPPPRFWHGSSSDDDGENIYIHGGQGSTGPLSDLWRYNVADDSWTQIAMPPGPGPMMGHAIFVRGDNLFIVGAANQGSRFAVFQLNLQSGVLAEISFAQSQITLTPPKFFVADMTTDASRIFIYSGVYSSVSAKSSRTLLLDLNSGSIELTFALANQPESLQSSLQVMGAAVCPDKINTVFFYGGSVGDSIELTLSDKLAEFYSCAIGYYFGNGQCLPCSPGRYLALNRTCVPCAKGFYNSESAQTSCEKCTPGHYAPKTGMDLCLAAPAGTIVPESGGIAYESCPLGTSLPESGGTDCEPCDPGTYSSNPAQTCAECPTGTSQPDSTQTSCLSCVPGYYASTTKSFFCTACPAGSYAEESAASACHPCQEGYYSQKSGSSSCAPCPTNTYTSTSGGSSCLDCPIFSITIKEASTSCYQIGPVLLLGLLLFTFTAILFTASMTVIVGILLRIGIPRIRHLLRLREEARMKAFYARVFDGEVAAQLQIPFDQLEFLEEIGHGAYGVVFRARWHGSIVAVKRLMNFRYSSASDVPSSYVRDVRESFETEMKLMAGLRHPNVLLLIGAVVDGGEMCIVTEYMDHGSLYNLLRSREISFSHFVENKILLGTARGMAYLHNENIIHRDLKSLNVLVDGNWTVKVADFGLSKLMSKEHTTMTQGAGTVEWIAPEVFISQDYTYKADVYSYAIICWEVVARAKPWDEMSQYNIMRMVERGDRPRIPSWCPVALQELMGKCWAPDPLDRPSFHGITAFLESVSGETSPAEWMQTTAAEEEEAPSASAPLLARKY